MLLQSWYSQSRALSRPLHHKRWTKQLNPAHVQNNFFSTSSIRPYRPLAALPELSLETFQQDYFIPENPVAFPLSLFKAIPALTKWFQPAQFNPDGQSTNSSNHATRLNTEYLQLHAADAFVPLELTELTDPAANEVVSFRQLHGPLNLFLEWMHMVETTPQTTRLYLAQCQLIDLPQILRDDLPTPEIVKKAGKGDVYDANVWIGHPPTYTPLHRDPNPNLFVQLAGSKTVRLLAPADGQAVFARVRRQLGRSGDRGSAAIRGEEMMQGEERTLLDEMVWGNQTPASYSDGKAFSVTLGAGDGLYIPKGWWHSIKGVGEGVTASVNWWFR